MSLQPGLNLLYEPQHGKVVVDIVFVHGLGGGHLSTWSEGDVCWPRDLLKEDLGDARIFSSAYDSKVIKLAEPTSSTSIAGHAESLLNEMGRARGYLREPRYIIFVCHSLGGLIVKQALIRSSEYYYNSQPYHTVVGSIFPSTLGVIFLGTPHRGSGKATLGKIAAIACKALGANSHILRDLERDSSLLEQQRNSFDSIRPHFQTICLWEELPMSMLGMIVPETSACIDGPEILKEHIPGSNHRSMAKFSSRSQKGYQIILSYLKRCLEKIPHGAPADIADRCILESLKFPGMNQRYGNVMRAHRSVVDSHKSTFDWAFSRNASGFVEWLESNDGLFWINGKAGSGKSTLMKFIAEDPRLKEHLLANNLSLPVFFEKFFFWAAGSPEQKSQTGLIKTILHGILTKNRQLIRVTFPDEWPLLYEAAGEIRQELLKKQNTSESMPTRVKDLLLMSRIDKQTLSKLSNLAELVWTRDQMVTYITNIFATSSTFRTFLFVDGLDEYDGSADDLAELIALLKTWANMPYVKICVSTRPWTIFETQFGKEKVPSIRLQDFTFHDIADFVADSFNSSPLMKVLQEANPEKIPDFYSSIAKKAEGVFLWVRLVVKSLMDGLLNGEELSLLQERVNELAADLENLYLQLLQRIPERYWVSSSRLFKIMQVADGAPRSLLLWYAGERNYDPLDFQSSAATKQARCYQVHLRLMSQCAGLLEVRTASGLDLAPGSDEDPDLMRPNTTWSFSTQQDYINSSVHYLHRTTRDFLLKDEIQQLMSRRLGNSSFDGVSWFAIHAFIEVQEVRSRIRKAGQEFGGWGNFGSELFQKQKRFKSLLSQCQNKEVAKTLSSLELKANLFDDTDSDAVTEQIDGDRQEGALNGRRKDELRKRISLALKYIDSI